MNNPCQAAAVVYVKDLRAMSRFYAEAVGLQVVEEAPGHVVLESSGFQLVLVAMPEHIAQQVHIATPPVRREETPIKLCFFVPGIAAVRERALACGGEMNAAQREWVFQGHRVCDGHDPEGNVLQVRGPVR
ncbi:VOC family protein [Ideonella sp. BN130291]|uniref:VOC family protein n=1 Tax=Ideonella sp. BN130291 TaxID=3112940 RepID=UPI002E258C28|nr:VOC family protein [Ideonella sp. BN130291]